MDIRRAGQRGGLAGVTMIIGGLILAAVVLVVVLKVVKVLFVVGLLLVALAVLWRVVSRR